MCTAEGAGPTTPRPGRRVGRLRPDREAGRPQRLRLAPGTQGDAARARAGVRELTVPVMRGGQGLRRPRRGEQAHRLRRHRRRGRLRRSPTWPGTSPRASGPRRRCGSSRSGSTWPRPRGSWGSGISTWRRTQAWRTLQHDRLFGYQELQPSWGPEDALRHVVPEDRPIFRKAFEEALVTGHFHYELRIDPHDQPLRWIEADGEVSRDAAGKPVRMLGTVADVTERKQRRGRPARERAPVPHPGPPLPPRHRGALRRRPSRDPRRREPSRPGSRTPARSWGSARPSSLLRTQAAAAGGGLPARPWRARRRRSRSASATGPSTSSTYPVPTTTWARSIQGSIMTEDVTEQRGASIPPRAHLPPRGHGDARGRRRPRGQQPARRRAGRPGDRPRDRPRAAGAAPGERPHRPGGGGPPARRRHRGPRGGPGGRPAHCTGREEPDRLRPARPAARPGPARRRGGRGDALAPATVAQAATVQVEDGGAPEVVASIGQLEQVVVNLVTNAARAIPAGRRGLVVVRIGAGTPGMSRLEVDRRRQGHRARAFLERIFEPFFTTRRPAPGGGWGSAWPSATPS